MNSAQNMRRPRFNREILASINFEPKATNTTLSARVLPPTATSHEPTTDPGASPSPQLDEDNEATRQVIQCMKIALSKSISSISVPEKDRPLDPHKDFTISSTVNLPTRDDEEAMITRSGCCSSTGIKRSSPTDDDDDRSGPPVSFTFTDHSPMCYRHIREFFSIDPQSYREVLCQSKWRSIPTPGKSAAQLFFCGQNWVIKTMSQSESTFLRDILHRYYYHVRDNPFTLLPHFVGHHMIEINGKKITFVIMQNVFATTNKIHIKFDLKGSTVGRNATRVEKMKQTCTQKDLDINRPMLIGPTRRTLLMEQMKKDVDFLRRAYIMDYSFLVGIHIQTPPYNRPAAPMGNGTTTAAAVVGSSPSLTLDERCFTADQGGMFSVDDPAATEKDVYYVGIIDILQEYNLWKRSETLVQGIRSNRHEISSVHPKEYAARFLRFMSSIIV